MPQYHWRRRQPSGLLCRVSGDSGLQRLSHSRQYLRISDELAAIFDLFGNAVHTALSFDLVGEDMPISGAGPIGIMSAVCKHVGARNVVITDINDSLLELARKMGATRELGMTEGFDVGLEMSGAPPAFRTLLEVMNHCGRIALLGIPPGDMAIDWNQVIFKGVFIKGIYGREMFEAWYKWPC